MICHVGLTWYLLQRRHTFISVFTTAQHFWCLQERLFSRCFVLEWMHYIDLCCFCAPPKCLIKEILILSCVSSLIFPIQTLRYHGHDSDSEAASPSYVLVWKTTSWGSKPVGHVWGFSKWSCFFISRWWRSWVHGDTRSWSRHPECRFLSQPKKRIPSAEFMWKKVIGGQDCRQK